MTIKEVSISDEELRVLLETGYILREAAKFDESEAVFRGVMEFIPESEVPQVGLGTVFLQRGDFETAEEVCRTATETNPSSLYAKVHFAEALLFQKKRDEAEDILNSVISENPDSPHSHTAQALLDAADSISPR